MKRISLLTDSSYKLLPLRHFVVLIIIIICLYFLSCNQQKQDPLTPFQRKWLSEHEGKINLVEYAGFPPLEFRNDRDEWVGISSDYIKLIEARLGFKFKRVRAENLTRESWEALCENQISVKCNF